MSTLDPRVTPFRPDLAAKHLQGQVEAAHFVEGTSYQVIDPLAPVRRAPAHDAPLQTEALFGERVTVYETDAEGWAWGQLEADGYVGWLPLNALIAATSAPTHKISALRTFGFPAANIKTPPILWLPLGARIRVQREQPPFVVTPFTFVPARHVAALETTEHDFVSVAERFLGTPYLWGGKSANGIDCSGLVQTALQAAGVACPRDSDMQEAALGEPAPVAQLRRGDLVFWKGHVAIARDATTLIHANAYHMAVAIEPTADALARINAAGSDVTSVRRVAC